MRGRRPSVRSCARSSRATKSRATSSRKERDDHAIRSARGTEPLEAISPSATRSGASTCTPSTTSRSSCTPGRSPRSSAKAGAERATVARLLARLYDASEGAVIFDGGDVSRARSRRDVLRYRSQVQMIFQDPFASLNPVKTIRHHLERPLRIHRIVPPSQVEERVLRAAAHGRARSAARRSRRSTRTSFQAGSGSASRSHARSPSSRRSSSPTSRSACSTSRSGSGS